MPQFSLRSLLIITAVFAILFALPVRRAIVQKRGRDWVAREGGHIGFGHTFDRATHEYRHDAQLTTPEWMIHLFGIDFFDYVDRVILDCYAVVDLRPIADFPNLRLLVILVEIDDHLDFSPLTELTHLEEVYLDYTDISIERLAALRDLLPNVRVDAANHPPSPEHGR